MDHQHLHQHQQWRPRPQIQDNICPTCSFSHFPFCPPPPQPSFNQNPRFPFDANHSFQRPGFDPYRGTVGMHRPLLGNPNDAFANSRPWGRNPYEQNAYREGFAAPPPYDYGGTGFVGGEIDRSFKRPRVDDFDSGGVVGEFNPNPGGTSWDDERRLKLIREHGFQDQGLSSGENIRQREESGLDSGQKHMQNNNRNGFQLDKEDVDSRNTGGAPSSFHHFQTHGAKNMTDSEVGSTRDSLPASEQACIFTFE